LNYTILGIDLDHDYMPVILRAHGTSALASRQLITQLKMNRALRGEYYRALVNIRCQEKNTPFGMTYVIHPKIVELITDQAKAEELKVESNRLLGAPIPLPEGRPDEEAGPEPLGYTPTGTPFYSEEEREGLMALAPATAIAPATTPAAEAPAAASPAATKEPEPPKEEKKEPTEKELDLDF